MMMRKWRLLCCLFGICCFAALLPWLRERLPDEFRVDQCAACVFDEEFPAFSLSDCSDRLNQPFTYLGHGVESVAFVSRDGKSVLKFFLQTSMHGKRRLSLFKPTHLLPGRVRAKQERRRAVYRKSLLETLKNYAAVYQAIPDLAGLLAIHLTPTENLLPTVRLFDAHGQEHIVDLDRTLFVLQQRATLVTEALTHASPEETEALLQELERLFVLRAQKGFTDRRKGCTLETNFGFVDGRAIQFDVGKVVFSEELLASPDNEIHRMTEFLNQWRQGFCYP